MSLECKVRKSAFLDALSKGLTVSRASQLARINRTYAYELRKANSEFAQAWDEALIEGTDHLIDEARRRAVEGTLRPVVHAGRVVTQSVYDTRLGVHVEEELWLREYSDKSLIMLLRARDPERFNDAVVLAKFQRKWAKEDAGADVRLIPG